MHVCKHLIRKIYTVESVRLVSLLTFQLELGVKSSDYASRPLFFFMSRA